MKTPTLPTHLEIRYVTKRGAHVVEVVRTNGELKTRLEKLSKRGQACRVYEPAKSGEDHCGGVWKTDRGVMDGSANRRWFWTFENDLLPATADCA